MPTYVMLSTLTPEGVQTLKSNPSRIREVNKEIEQLGVTVKAQWAVLGRFDFVNIIEAPDEKSVARVSMELGSRGTMHLETLSAIPALPGEHRTSGACGERWSARTIACSRPPAPMTRTRLKELR